MANRPKVAQVEPEFPPVRRKADRGKQYEDAVRACADRRPRSLHAPDRRQVELIRRRLWAAAKRIDMEITTVITPEPDGTGYKVVFKLADEEGTDGA